MKLRTHSRGASARRAGTVVVVFAVSLTAMLSVIALSLDGGILMDKRRQAQGAADSAALAAANDLYKNWFITTSLFGAQFRGLDPTGSAKAAALAEAKANGYEDGVNGCTVTVNIPPLSGPFTGMPCHTEVIISTTQTPYFSRLFATDDVPYGARAVSRGRRGGINDAIICLDPTGKGALSAGGSNTCSVTVQGAPIQVNSNNAEAMVANGNGAMTAPQFLVSGSPGYSTPGGGSFTGTIVPNSQPIPDPLASMPVPNPATMPVYNSVHQSGNKTTDLTPGVYQGGITASGGTLNLAPGVYYMQGGGFSVSGTANIFGSGVMIYNAPQGNNDVISIAGQGTIVLSPPMTGPYQGILLFQDRTATAPVSVSGSNGTTLTLSGTFYCANATLNVTGNGANQTIGSQYISYDLALGGNGSYFCSWSPDLTPGTREILLVE